MEERGCTYRPSFRAVMTWYQWHATLAVLGVILCCAVTDRDSMFVAAGNDQPFAQLAHVDHDNSVWSLAFSGGTHLAWSTTSKIRLNNLANGEIVELGDSPGSFGPYPAFSPDGKFLAVGGKETEVRLWDTATGRELEPLTLGTTAVKTFAISPDGTTLAVATAHSSVATLWDWPRRRPLAALDGHAGTINLLAFAPDGRTLLTADSVGEVQLWDVASRRVARERRVHASGITAMAYSPDGRLFATASYMDSAVRLWDAAAGEPRGSLQNTSTGVTGLAFSPGGTTLATSQRNGVASLWALESRQRVGAVRVPTGSLQAIAFRGDGRVFATAGFDGSVRFWDVNNVIATRSHEP